MIEETAVPELRWWLSYGGTASFFLFGMIGIWRGSIKINWRQHNKLMKYWERIFSSIYCLFVFGVQIGTFTMRELWDIKHGPDDAWEIIWGLSGLFAAGMCLNGLVSKQCYRLHLHHALLLHLGYCIFCTTDLIIRDNLSWHVTPMFLLTFYALWMLAVAPRTFQITGHASVMATNDEEWFVLLYGIPRRYQEITSEDLDRLKYAALSKFSRCVLWCSDRVPKINARAAQK